MCVEETYYSVAAFVSSPVLVFLVVVPLTDIVHDWVCEHETVSSVPSALQITHELLAVGRDIAEMRKGLWNLVRHFLHALAEQASVQVLERGALCIELRAKCQYLYTELSASYLDIGTMIYLYMIYLSIYHMSIELSASCMTNCQYHSISYVGVLSIVLYVCPRTSGWMCANCS